MAFSSSKLFFGLFVLLVATAVIVKAQDDDVIVDSLQEDMVFSSSDVKYATVFPDHPTKSFPTATIIDSYTSFQNLGQKTFNLTSIYGSINYLQDPNVYLQNFTRLRYDVVVQPGDEVTFEFQFVADQSLEPRDYHMLIRADYYDLNTGLMYTTTFVNSTVTLIENPAAFDWTGTVVTLSIILGTAGYVANKWYAKKADKAAKASKKSRLDEDLAGTAVRLTKSPKGK